MMNSNIGDRWHDEHWKIRKMLRVLLKLDVIGNFRWDAWKDRFRIT